MVSVTSVALLLLHPGLGLALPEYEQCSMDIGQSNCIILKTNEIMNEGRNSAT